MWQRRAGGQAAQLRASGRADRRGGRTSKKTGVNMNAEAGDDADHQALVNLAVCLDEIWEAVLYGEIWLGFAVFCLCRP
jgi:hypothetical protein